MKTLKLVAVICLFAAAFIGCQKEKTVADPEGTIEMNIRNVSNGGTNLHFIMPDGIDLGWFHIDDANNFSVPNDYGNRYSKIDFVKVNANCLGNITTIPSSGWSNQLGVNPGNGYIARVKNSEEGPYKDQTYYCRICVTSWITAAGTNGIIGAEVKYQFPMPN